MSAAITCTRSIVRKQLSVIGCRLFDLGILDQHGRMLLREKWSAELVDTALAWFRRDNARGAHIFVRPHGAHALSLVDDLDIDAIARMTDGGFQLALVVETSPGNFQACVNHGRILSDHTFSIWPQRNWHVASAETRPVPTGGTSVGSRASRIRSRWGVCGTACPPSPNVRRGRYLERLRSTIRSDPSVNFTGSSIRLRSASR